MQWESFYRIVNDRRTIVIAPIDIERQPDRPFLCRMLVRLLIEESASADPISLHEDIEEVLVPIIRDLRGCYVGSLTADATREYFAYVPEPDQASAAMEAAGDRLAPHELLYRIDHDPQWLTFHELLEPTDSERQWIMDRSAVALLRDKGDPLTVPRRITHLVSFYRLEDRDAFLTAILHLGEARKLPPDDSQPRFGVELVTHSPATLQDISASTSVLRETAELHDGEYGGWESQVIATSSADL